MVTDSSTPNGVTPAASQTGEQPDRHIRNRVPKRPLAFWIVLCAAAIGGLTLSTLMVLAAIVAVDAKEHGYAAAFAATAGACAVLPVLIVWATMEKMLRMVNERDTSA